MRLQNLKYTVCKINTLKKKKTVISQDILK